MATARSGHEYSGTPLWRKLGVAEASTLLLVNAPPAFPRALVALEPLPPGVEIRTRASNGLDVIVVFSTARADVQRRFPKLATSLDPAGRLWIAWPKKAAKVETDLTFEVVQGIGLDAGLVDNKSASVDGIYQGLQFVYRLRDRLAR